MPGTDPPLASWQRLLLGSVLAIGLALLSGVVGMFIAGRCCVPQGSGLAGPGIVVGYGLLAALGGLIAGLLLAFLLERKRLMLGSAVAGVGGLAVVVLLAIAVIDSANNSSAALAEAYERLPAFELTIDLEEGTPFARFEADWDARETMVSDAGGGACRRPLAGREAVALLEALRAVEGVLMDGPQPCASHRDALVQRVSFSIREARPPNSSGAFSLTAACLVEHPALGTPLDAARRALRRAGKCLDDRPAATP